MVQRTGTHPRPSVAVKSPWVLRPGELLERHFGRLMPFPALAIISLLIIFPLAFNLYMSLQTWFVSSATLPQFVGVRNFIEIFGKDVRFWNSIWTTVKFTAIGVWLELILGLGIA